MNIFYFGKYKSSLTSTHIFLKINSLDFAPVYHEKSFGNLRWTPESSNQINTKRCAILVIIIL